MLLKNSIKGVAKLQLTFLNGEAFYRIDLKKYKSLKEYFDGRKLIFRDVHLLLKALSEVLARLDNYLLKAESLLLAPEYIYFDEGENEWLFICLPEMNGDFGSEKLAEYLIERTDENDSRAFELSSDYFNIAAEGGISPANIISVDETDKKKRKAVKKGRPLPERRRDFGGSIPVIPADKKEKDKDREALKKKNLRTGIIICILLLTAAVGLYIFLLSNPSLLTVVGLSGDDYLTAGAIIALVFAAAIIGVIHVFRKKTETDGDRSKESDEKSSFAESYDDCFSMDYLDGEIEKARSHDYDNDFESDYPEDDFEEINYREKNYEEEEFEESSSDYDEDEDEETVLLTSNGNQKQEKAFASLKGKLNGNSLVFSIGETPFLIGKMKGRVNGIINDGGVSRIHACIRKVGSRYFINDLNSTNGTCLNDRRLQPDENAEIRNGDIVKFGHVTMRFAMN